MEILPGVRTEAITFNGTVPGPTIRLTEGDAVEVVVRDDLDEPTSVHWHGLHVPNDQHGVAGVTQDPIAAGATFTHRFIAPRAGTFKYHAHGGNSRVQIDQGLYAPRPAEREPQPRAGHTMAPDMTEMPGMRSMPGMTPLTEARSP